MLMSSTVINASAKEIRTRSETVKESTVYAGEVYVDGEAQLQYLYSSDISYNPVVFENLKKAFGDTDFYDMVPELPNDATGTGLAVSSAHEDEMDENWSSVSYVAKKYFEGTVGEETNGELPAAEDVPRVSNGVDVTGTPFNDYTFNSTLSISFTSEWEMIDGILTKVTVATLNNEKTQIIYKKVEVSTAVDTRKKGDLNNNGRIDASDLLQVKSHIKKVKTLEGDDFKVADVDDDGIINARDLLKMKSHMKNISLLW